MNVQHQSRFERFFNKCADFVIKYPRSMVSYVTNLDTGPVSIMAGTILLAPFMISISLFAIVLYIISGFFTFLRVFTYFTRIQQNGPPEVNHIIRYEIFLGLVSPLLLIGQASYLLYLQYNKNVQIPDRLQWMSWLAISWGSICFVQIWIYIYIYVLNSAIPGSSVVEKFNFFGFFPGTICLGLAFWLSFEMLGHMHISKYDNYSELVLSWFCICMFIVHIFSTFIFCIHYIHRTQQQNNP